MLYKYPDASEMTTFTDIKPTIEEEVMKFVKNHDVEIHFHFNDEAS